MTGNDLARRALRTIGVLASGETPSAAEAQDLLTIANAMLNTWAAERLMVFTITRKEFTPPSNKQVYSYGPGGDFDDYRPPSIDRVSIITNVGSSQPLELPIDYLTDAMWQDIPTKNVTSTFPRMVWDDGNFPLRNLSYYPIPTAAWKPVFYVWTQLNQFVNLTTNLNFPPGYEEAIVYNTALRAVPEYGAIVDPATVAMVAGLAAESKGVVKSLNIPIIDLRCDDAVVDPRAQVYNWRSDSWVKS